MKPSESHIFASYGFICVRKSVFVYGSTPLHVPISLQYVGQKNVYHSSQCGVPDGSWSQLLDLLVHFKGVQPRKMLSFAQFSKGEFQTCPHLDFDNILYVEYPRYNNYKNEIILFLEGC